MSEEDNQIGRLRGIGLRPDPAGILITPFEQNGEQWGYTIVDKTTIPSMNIDGEWRNVVPEGVWMQMLENWDLVGKTDKAIFDQYPVYLDYPEVQELINE
jgi:hypothetical protein